MNGVGQKQTRDRDRPHVFVVRTRRRVLHAGSRLRQEVLHDDFLYVTVLLMRFGNGKQRCNAVFARFADADEDSRRERNLQFARPTESVESTLRHFVGSTAMACEVVAQRFDHHSLRRRNRTQQRKFVLVQRACVGVGEEAGFVKNQLRHVVHVVNGAVVSVRLQPVRCNLVAQFGPFAQGEQRLVATVAGTLLGDAQHGVGREVRVLESRGRLGERAVTARVATQHGERNEHLRRIGDP